MQGAKKPNIYSMAREIEQEASRKEAIEARNITNAYRQVEQLRVQKSLIEKTKQILPKATGSSTYATKIKETLKQIIANRQIQQKERNIVVSNHIGDSNKKKVESKEEQLKKTAARNIEQIVQKLILGRQQSLLMVLFKCNEVQIQKEDRFVCKLWLRKVFKAWKEETIFIKIEKEKQAKEMRGKEEQAKQIASEFHNFTLLKKCCQGWKQQAKNESKRMLYMLQLQRQQLEWKIHEDSKNKRMKGESTSGLQSKVRGFLADLKDKVQQKNRLATIKQNQDEHIHVATLEQENPQLSLLRPQQEEPTEETQHNIEQSLIGASPEVQPIDPKKSLTNEQLQRRREQLEHKYKSRKQTLENLKKQKQDKKREQQQKRLQIQKQIQAQTKKIKQEQYRIYLKNKQQLEEWQRKEKDLHVRADESNRLRLLVLSITIQKYYGWVSWTRLFVIKQEKCSRMEEVLGSIALRVHFTDLAGQILEISRVKLQNLYDKMVRIQSCKLVRKCFKALRGYEEQQRNIKAQLTIRHEVHTLKIFLAEWKRVMPTLEIENFEWQKPRNRRAEDYHRINLLQKGLMCLQHNKQDSKKSKNIEEHKAKLKTRIRNLLDDNQQVDYQQFL